MKKPKLTIVILSYNVKELLRGCLDSLEKTREEVGFEVIIPDNHSTDGSPEMVKKEFPWVKKVLRIRENVGFAAGNNVALKEIQSKYVLLLNPDTIVYKNSIKRVLDYMEENINVGAATCKVELSNGELDYSCHRGFPTPWNAFCYFSGLSKLFPKLELFGGYTLSYKNFDQAHEIDALTGAYALIRTKAGTKVGWFDEDYFWNGEDIDFCYKLREKGWKVAYIPDVKITHFKGSASGLKKTKSEKPEKHIRKRAALSSTNVMRLFYKKHLAEKYPAPLNYLVYLGINILEVFRVTKHSI
jgi:GT2 family glycosyltransferase